MSLIRNYPLFLRRRRGAGEPPIITATLAPAPYSYSDGDTVGDHPDFATLDTTGNYASTASGTIASVEWLVDGTDRASSYVLSAGQSVVVRVTDGAAEFRDWTIDASVAATVPDAFTAGDWTLASDGSEVTISTLPDDGGSALTDLEYRVNSGSAVSLSATTTGTYAITASEGDDVQIRAVNAVGAGAWSDTKTVSAFEPSDLFASGEAGWLINASAADTFLTPQNLTLATTTQTSGFALDEHAGAGYSGGAFTGLGSEELPNPGDPFVNTTGWSAQGSASFSVVSDNFRITANDGSFEGALPNLSGLTVGATYKIKGVIAASGGTGSKRVATAAGEWSNDFLEVFTSGQTPTYEWVARAGLTAPRVVFTAVISGAGDETLDIQSASVRQIPGSHGEQNSASFRPILRADGLEYDGIDDRLTTSLTPTTEGTLVARFDGDTASRVIMGSQPATDGRAFLALDASGRLAAGIGTQSTATIFGGSDIRGTEHVGAVTWDGTTVKLYLDGTEVYSAAQSGAVNTTVAMTLGSLNANGTPSAFWDGIIGQSIAIDRALTASEISNLTTYWSA